MGVHLADHLSITKRKKTWIKIRFSPHIPGGAGKKLFCFFFSATTPGAKTLYWRLSCPERWFPARKPEQVS
jgi:hypothetical protein